MEWQDTIKKIAARYMLGATTLLSVGGLTALTTAVTATQAQAQDTVDSVFKELLQGAKEAPLNFSKLYDPEAKVRRMWPGYDQFYKDNKIEGARDRANFIIENEAVVKEEFVNGVNAQKSTVVRSNTPGAGTMQTTTSQSPNAPASLEPQAAYDKLWERMEVTYDTKKTPAANRLSDVKLHLEKLKQTNVDVYNLITAEAAASTKGTVVNNARKRAAGGSDATAQYMMFLMTWETDSLANTAGDNLDAKVAGMQKQVNLGHVEDMALQIAGLQDASKSLGEDIQKFDKMKKEERKQRNKERMANLLAMQARVAVATAGNAVLGSLEKEADLHNNEKVSEAIRNMRYIYEDAFGIRERGAANTDMSREWGLAWNEIQRDLVAYDKLTDEKQKLEAEKKIHDKVAKAVKKECERFCEKNGITPQEMQQIFSENGVTAVGPRVQQNPMSPETLKQAQEASASWATLLEEAKQKPDFDTVGDLIAAEKAFSLKYAPTSKGGSRGV